MIPPPLGGPSGGRGRHDGKRGGIVAPVRNVFKAKITQSKNSRHRGRTGRGYWLYEYETMYCCTAERSLFCPAAEPAVCPAFTARCWLFVSCGVFCACVVFRQGSANEYSFDAVFPPEAGQSEVYEGTAKPHISELLEGINVTVFAYGATGESSLL